MARIVNPHYADPIATWAEANRALVVAQLQARAGVQSFSFDQARAFLGSAGLDNPDQPGAPLSDGHIDRLCRTLGLVVVADQ